MENIKVLFRKPINQPLEIAQMVNNLEGIYDLLKCHSFTAILIGEGVWCLMDEEGMLKINPENNFYHDRYGWIVGNVAFCGKRNGELISITNSQMHYVSDYLGFPLIQIEE